MTNTLNPGSNRPSLTSEALAAEATKLEFGEYARWCASQGRKPMSFSAFQSHVEQGEPLRGDASAMHPELIRRNNEALASRAKQECNEARGTILLPQLTGGITRDDTEHGETYYTEKDVQQMMRDAVVSDRARYVNSVNSAPPGYKLVAREPIEAMIHVAQDLPAPRMFGIVWRAMWDAAPGYTRSSLSDAEIIKAQCDVGLSRGNHTDFITFAREIERRLSTP